MAKRGKKYREAFEKVDRTEQYGPTAAFTLLKETVSVNFDPTVDVAIKLGVDPRQADEMVRGAIVLPHGIGKSLRVAVRGPRRKRRTPARTSSAPTRSSSSSPKVNWSTSSTRSSPPPTRWGSSAGSARSWVPAA